MRRLVSRFGPFGVLGLLQLGLAGCGTLSSLDAASRQFDTFELSAPQVSDSAAVSGGGGPSLFVALPVSSGAIASERIVIKPDAFRVAVLPDAQWVDPAPVHVQQLITRAVAQANRFALVSGSSSGPLPDYSLITFLEAFQVEVTGTGSSAPAPMRVSVALQAALTRDSDGQIIARRRFAAESFASSDEPEAVVPAFDAATGTVLRDLVNWLRVISPGQA